MFVARGSFLGNHNYEVTRRFDGAMSTARAEGLTAKLLAEDPVGFMGPLAAEKIKDPVEREGEFLRRRVAPERCSRLGGVFIFADSDSCARASALYGWGLESVRHGRAYGECNAYDMQIVSAIRMPGLDASTRTALWESYWTGAPGEDVDGWDALLPHSYRAPLWEWVVDGYVQFDSEDQSPFRL